MIDHFPVLFSLSVSLSKKENTWGHAVIVPVTPDAGAGNDIKPELTAFKYDNH